MAVLGDVAQPGLVDHLLRASRVESLAAHRDRPRSRVAQARERVDQLALAVVVDAGDADDLAGANLERDAAHLLDVAVVEHVEVLDLEQRLSGLRRGLLDAEHDLAADHQLREAGLGRAFARDRVDLLAAAQDADPVGDLEHLVQLVGDEDDRHALGLSMRRISNSSSASCGVSTAVGSSRIRMSAER